MSREAALARYYPKDIESAIQITNERIEEWDYDTDPHGYCHERPVLMALIHEIGRLRNRLDDEPTPAHTYAPTNDQTEVCRSTDPWCNRPADHPVHGRGRETL